MSRLRLGVIGAGSWTVASHLPNLAKRRGEIDFAAVCRIGVEPLQRIKDDWGFGLASEDYRDVIAAGIDICVIASPPAHHYVHAKAALEAGAHVLLEKPFTVSAADAWDLVATAERRGLHLIVSYGWNYLPMVREAEALMRDPGIGLPEVLSVAMASQCRELLAGIDAEYLGSSQAVTPDQQTFSDPAISGGGYAQVQLTHALGLALWLTGLRGQDVFALMAAPGETPVELHDAFAIRFRGGAIGTVYGGSCHSGAGGGLDQLEVRAIGTEGQLHIDLERARLWLYRADGREIDLDLNPSAGLYDCEGPVTALVDLALGCRAENCSPGELGARTVEILEAAYRSAASQQLEPVVG